MNLKSELAYINGEWIETKNTFPVTNPFDNSLIANVSDCGEVETREAIDAAYQAFKIWSKFSASKRSRILKNWYNLQIEHLEELAQILTLEQGKPLSESKGEIKYGASFVEWFAEESRRVYGDVIPGHMSNVRVTVHKEPIGVVGAITPWNFPSSMITRKVAPALAAGCTVVLKPSEHTPLSALALAKLAEKAGFPAGVINIVTSNDPKEVGKCLTNDQRVRKISFTGSTAVGKILLKQSADQVKRVSLELGGNAPFIVFEDADIDKAVEGCLISKYRNAGQTCICSNRIFLHEGIYNEFIDKINPKLKALKLGNGMDKAVQIGPMINEKALLKVEHLLNDALAKGGKLIAGGKRLENLLFQPTLLCDLNENMEIFNTEIFGPVAAIYKFSTEKEVIDLANKTNYGLAAYFYGQNYAKIWRVAEALEYGMVGINTGMISAAAAPFGGIKESGFGREGSKYGIEEYLNIKYLCWGEVQ